jgi:hypothetical protein
LYIQDEEKGKKEKKKGYLYIINNWLLINTILLVLTPAAHQKFRAKSHDFLDTNQS